MPFDHQVVEKTKNIRNVLKPVFDLFVDIKTTGKENIPVDGPFILVSNHRSDMDPWVLTSAFPRYISWIADHYLFELPLIGKFMNEIGAIRISSSRSDQYRAFRRTKEVLESGHVVGIFPEGHDTMARNLHDLDLGDFHDGFADLALRFKVPILPCAVLSFKEKYEPLIIPPFVKNIFHVPEDVLNIERRLVYEKVHVHFGKPISIEPYLDRSEAEKENAVIELSAHVRRLILETVLLHKENRKKRTTL